MVVWDQAADARLLLAILQTAQPKLDHDAIAKAMGDDVTGYAIQHRLRKLKEKAKGGANSAGSSPTKSPAKSPAKSPTGGKRSRTAKAKDGETTGESSKKPKAEADDAEDKKPAV